MAARNDSTDRNGKAHEMKMRGVRLTADEDKMLNNLMVQTGLKLRDLIAQLVEEKYNNLNSN